MIACIGSPIYCRVVSLTIVPLQLAWHGTLVSTLPRPASGSILAFFTASSNRSLKSGGNTTSFGPGRFSKVPNSFGIVFLPFNLGRYYHNQQKEKDPGLPGASMKTGGQEYSD